MTGHRFSQVDVFADGAFTGNPLAVVHDADDVDPADMQRLTRWTNLSEAAFLTEPTSSVADYRVRIFEPKHELPFAGHPTLGACAAWLHAGGEPRTAGQVVQECGAGLVRIRLTRGGLAFAAPPMIRHEPIEPADLERALRVLDIDPADVLDAHWIDNGPGWMGLLLRDAECVRRIERPTETAQHFDVGVVGLDSSSSVCGVVVRAFFNDPAGTIREDPVTGSLNASVAQWLLGNGRLVAPYTARQTTGRVSVDLTEGDIWIGGVVDVHIVGTIDLDRR